MSVVTYIKDLFKTKVETKWVIVLYRYSKGRLYDVPLVYREEDSKYYYLSYSVGGDINRYDKEGVVTRIYKPGK